MLTLLTLGLAAVALGQTGLTWERQADMIFARSDMVAVVVGDDFYLMGGCDGNQSVVTNQCPSITDDFTMYNFASDQFSPLPNAPRPRYRYAAAAVGDKIFYIGGRDLVDNVIPEVDVYDITLGTWSVLPDQGGVTSVSDASAFVIDSKLYVSGGYSAGYAPLASTMVLDTTANQLIFSADLVADKLIAAGDNGALAVGKYAYVFGGFGSDWSAPIASVECYDSVLNTWSSLADMVSARADMAFAVVNTTLFVIGGETKDSIGNSVALANVELYNTLFHSWEIVSPIAIPRFRFTSAGWEDMQRIFDIGGQLSFSSSDTVSSNDFYTVLNKVYSASVADVIPSPQPVDGISRLSSSLVVVLGLLGWLVL